ncbi:MAG: hypothetical protein DDG58_06315 [Ardenticatenia bacterium]|nr:MAG: hypothetical protein DDG58_06315 [Ardenticatenia bacterium]
MFQGRNRSMGTTLLILVFDDVPFRKGSVSFSGTSLDNIKAIFPDFLTLDPESIENAIGVFVKRDYHDLPAKRLKVHTLKKSSSSALIGFTVETELPISSGEVLKRARGQLIRCGLLKQSQYLPLCCLLNAEQAAVLLTSPSSDLRNDLSALLQRNNWQGIYQRFAPVGQVAEHHPEIWNDPETLSTVGFACSKLSEVSGIPPEIFRDESEKKKFLSQQARYRREAETLYKRCIELDPDNPRHWSSLGYLYYRSVMELTQPRGRRDGNIYEETKKALDCLDKALSLDPSRVKDLYRKGYLLAEIMPDQIRFGFGQREWADSKERWKAAVQHLQQGLDCFLKAIQIWEALPSSEDDKRKRCRKEYIKCLYHAGCTYHALIPNEWDEISMALDSREEDASLTAGQITYRLDDLKNVDLAWHYLYKCWSVDRDGSLIEEEKEPTESNTPAKGAEDGVYKLYWLGKILFTRYWILSGYGIQDTSEDCKRSRDQAEKLFLAALQVPWPPEKQRQTKEFIAERLARVYISKREEKRAIEIIRRYSRKPAEAYIAHTWALALMRQGQYKEALSVLMQVARDRSNKEPWTTHFLIGCTLLEQEQYDEAHRAFEAAAREAEKQGKENFDGLLIGQAFIAYKCGDLPKAIAFLEEAMRLNPYRSSTRMRLQSWRKQLQN